VITQGKKPTLNCIDRIAVAGDSAGATFAILVALEILKHGGPKLACELLVYPSVNLASLDTKTYALYGKGHFLTKRCCERFVKWYLPPNQDPKDPRVSSQFASKEHLGKLPPTFIISAESDVLREECEEFGMKINEYGVSVKNVRYNGTIHGFWHRGFEEIFAKYSESAIQDACAFLREHFK